MQVTAFLCQSDYLRKAGLGVDSVEVFKAAKGIAGGK
jgi:hypothetical protein